MTAPILNLGTVKRLEVAEARVSALEALLAECATVLKPFANVEWTWGGLDGDNERIRLHVKMRDRDRIGVLLAKLKARMS